MAMELHVLSDRRLKSVGEWQRALDAAGFPLRLAADVELSTASGLVPAKLGNEETGFECYHDDAREMMRFLGGGNFDHDWTYALGFRWRGDFSELNAAWMAATAYAEATGGIIFDHEEGRAFTPQEGRALVSKFLSDTPRLEALIEKIKRDFSTRP